MKIDVYHIDAFTNQLFAGNPAAVCPLSAFPSDEVMQSIAAENNLPVTAFFTENHGKYSLRTFTPGSEVNLCGHATLAAAYVIFNMLNQGADNISFDSKSGLLQVEKMEGGSIQLNFPVILPEEADVKKELEEALGMTPVATYRSTQDFLAVFDNQAQIEAISPDFDKLVALDLRGVIVSSQSADAEFDFVSRFFVPKFGVPEDPVTGSAHCLLTPYWSKKLSKLQLKAKQLSARGGELVCELKGDTVYLTGQAVPYSKGVITV